MLNSQIGSSSIDLKGDSITQGAGGGGQDRYYWLRRAFPDRVIRVNGIGGIPTASIAAMQGGVPTKITVAGGALTSTTPVAATLSVGIGGTGDYYFSGQVDGQSVMIKHVAADNTYTICSTTGETPTITAGSAFIPDDAWNARTSIQSIGCGTNDRGVTAQATVAALLAKMVEYVKAPRRVLVHGVMSSRSEPIGSGATRTWTDQVNASRAALYGGKQETEFIPLAPPNAAEMAAIGYTPSSQDLTDIAAGIWPAGMIYAGDGLGLHPNGLGYRVIANREIAAITARDW